MGSLTFFNNRYGQTVCVNPAREETKTPYCRKMQNPEPIENDSSPTEDNLAFLDVTGNAHV